MVRYNCAWISADLVNNSASWQWVAGCGADAAPYFKVFNLISQGQLILRVQESVL